MSSIVLIPLRTLVFIVGFISYWMEVSADWIIGVRSRTEYVRTGKCKRCGKCCDGLALKLPNVLLNHDILKKLLRAWHEFAFNFRFISEEDGWFIYHCGYHKGSGKCAIYPFRHRLCRFYPRQGLHGYPPTALDCGFTFIKRH